MAVQRLWSKGSVIWAWILTKPQGWVCRLVCRWLLPEPGVPGPDALRGLFQPQGLCFCGLMARVLLGCWLHWLLLEGFPNLNGSAALWHCLASGAGTC